MSPYIEEERRKIFDHCIDYLTEEAERVGELNYIITKLLFSYIQKCADADGIDYSACNAMMGVLECVKQEFYRRVVIPYEDKKCKENGDVF